MQLILLSLPQVNTFKIIYMKIKNILCVCFVIATTKVIAQGALTVTSQAGITTSGTSTITLLNTKLTNNGVINDANGTLQYIGNATTANSTIEGTGTNTLNNLTVHKSSNAVQLDSDIAVSGNLNLTSGGVLLNNGNINLGSTGQIVNENETNNISGTGGNITTNVNLNAPTNSNPGNLGATITSTSNLGMTSITRTHSQQTTSEGSSMLRTYTIAPTNNTGLNATLTFAYLDKELNSNIEADLYIWESTDNGITWVQIESTVDTNANTLTLKNIDAFTQYTARSASPLGIESISAPDTFSIYKAKEQLHFNTKPCYAKYSHL